MDKMEALKSKLPFPLYNDREILCVFINGKRLDEILTESVNKNYLGLVPAWLDWYDEDYQPSLKEKQYVWEQTKLEGSIKILPILLCPDDFDFDCTIVVVEVIDNGDTVIWNRFGIDESEGRPPDIYDKSKQVDLSKYFGIKVRWFPNINKFVFHKTEYIACVKVFGLERSE